MTDASDPGTATAADDAGSTAGLLRWSWRQYARAPELVVPFALATLLVVAAQAGITTTATPYGTIPSFAPWVWPAYATAAGSVFLGFAVTLLAAGDADAGVDRPFARQLRTVAERAPEALIAGILGAITVVGGLLTLVVPGLYLFAKLALAVPACVVDDADAVTALRRSWMLTGGSKLTILSLVALYGVAVVVVSVLVTLLVPRPARPPGFVGPLVQNGATAVLAPLFGLAFGRLYVVRRG